MNAIKRTAAVLFLATGFLSPLHAQGGVKYFIYAPGSEVDFPGSTQDSTFKDKKAEEVLSFSMGSETPVEIGTISGGGGAGKAVARSLEIQFTGDLAILPKLIQKSTTGAHYNDLVIEGVTNGLTFFKLELKLCFIESVDLVGTQGDVAIFRAVIPFGAMKMTTSKLNPDGSVTPGTSVLWSYVKNNATFTVN